MIKLNYCLASLLAACVFSTASAEQTPTEQELGYLTVLYKTLHQTPELSFQEQQTARRMAVELESLGLDVSANIGGHGVVGILRNGTGKTIMLRADMDALPVAEKTGLAYASKVTVKTETGAEQPVMHACGHDMHMSVMIGVARQLAANKDQWQGTAMFVFEPAEERGAGSRLMLADGLFERFERPDFNLAYHVSAELPAGQIGLIEGYAMANVDSVDIAVRGVGGHGAYPHKTKDPVVIAAALILQLQTIISRELSPLDSAVITVGSIHGGSKHNIISDEVKLQLTVRSYSDETRDYLLRRIREMSEQVAKTYAVPDDRLPVVKVRQEYTPSVYNNPDLIKQVRVSLGAVVGNKNLVDVDPVMAGEDFSRYGRVEPKIPSALLWLGSVPQAAYAKAQQNGGKLPSLHSAEFSPDMIPTLTTGIKGMKALVITLLPVN